MSYDDPYVDMTPNTGDTRPRPRNGGGQARPSGGAQSAIESGKYTEVKVRLQMFYAAYPNGAVVTSKVEFLAMHTLDELPRVFVQALAYRSPDDPHPGVGSSWMVIPGKTPYTNGSEVENCETSAWGRAIAAVGIAIDQGIASAQEIRSKGGGEIEPPSRPADQLAKAAADAALPIPQIEPVSSMGDGAPAPVADAPVQESTTEALPVTAEPIPAGPTLVKTAEGNSPAAQLPAEQVQEGLSFEEFKRLAKEKHLLSGLLQQTAVLLKERGVLPADIAGVKDLTDQQRLTLLLAAMATSMDE